MHPSMVSLRKRPLIVPEPGQRVRLRAGRGPWRGSYRALSEPFTDERGVVVLRVAEEVEYRSATREGRHAIGTPWPVRQIAVILPSAGADEETGELPAVPQRFEKLPQSAGLSGPCPGAQEGTERPWWRRLFGR
jgi:hypothetical protein